MHLKSEAFAHQGRLPKSHVRKQIGGQNLSPPLTWGDAPEGTRSFALSCIDPHPVAKNWVHWLVVNVPPFTRKLAVGASGHTMPRGSHELDNSFGADGYDGPQPPAGTGDHPYVFTVYALSTDNIVLADQTSLAQFIKALEGKMLGRANLTGLYKQG